MSMSEIGNGAMAEGSHTRPELKVIFDELNTISGMKNHVQFTKIRPHVNQVAESIIKLTSFDIRSPRSTPFELITDENKRKLAISFMILLFSERDMFYDLDNVRFSILNILDQRCGEVLFGKSKKQNHEKEADILRYISSAEQKMAELEDIYIDTSNVDNARNKFNRTYNDSAVKLIFHPVYGESVDISKINQVFENIKLYFQSANSLVYTNYQNAVEIINETVRYVEDAALPGLDHLKKMMQAFLILIEKDFSSKGFASPAMLSIDTYNKKYDLTLVGRKISLAVILNNVESGRAMDIEIDLEFDSSFKPDDKFKFIGDLEYNQSRIVYFSGTLLTQTEFIIGEGNVS